MAIRLERARAIRAGESKKSAQRWADEAPRLNTPSWPFSSVSASSAGRPAQTGGSEKVGENRILQCGESTCLAQRVFRLAHYVSRAAADIEHLGQRQLEKLVESGLASRAPDLYRLTVNDLLSPDEGKIRSAERLIVVSRELGTERALVGLLAPH